MLLIKVFKPSAPYILGNRTVLRTMNMRAEQITDIRRKEPIEFDLQNHLIVVKDRHRRNVWIEDIAGTQTGMQLLVKSDTHFLSKASTTVELIITRA